MIGERGGGRGEKKKLRMLEHRECQCKGTLSGFKRGACIYVYIYKSK